MLPALLAFARAYAPMLVFPAAVVVGTIGYNLESLISDKQTPWKKSVTERREERHLKEEDKEFQVPKDIFQRRE